MHVVARSGEEQDAVSMEIVAGVIFTEAVVIGSVHGESMLVVEGGGVALEDILRGGTGLSTARRKATIDDKAEEVKGRGNIPHRGKRDVRN